MKKKLVNLILVVVVLTLVPVTSAQEGRITLKGYLMDKVSIDKVMMTRIPAGNGAVKLLDPVKEAKAHTKERMLVPDAVKSGYGIFYGTKDEGGWYPFDKRGNELARTLLIASTKTSGIRVEVTGRKTKKGFKVESIKEID